MAQRRTSAHPLPWVHRTGPARALIVVTAASVLLSAAVCAIAYTIAGWPLIATDPSGIIRTIIPVATPLICAPLACLPIVRAGRQLAELLSEVEETRATLEAEVTRRRKLQADLEELAARDPLTGLLNRRGFFKVAMAMRAQATVVTVDVNGLKPVNDTHGHAAGDEVLQAVAKRLRTAAGRDAAVARIGGDEFAALFTANDPAIPRTAAAFGPLPMTLADGREVTLSAAVGIAPLANGRDIDAALAVADRRMYSAKRSDARKRDIARKRDVARKRAA